MGSIPLASPGRKIWVEEAGFTGSSGSVRALSVYAKKELSGEGQKQRNGSEPSEVVRDGFGFGRKAVTQRVEVATVERARADGSGGFLAREPPKQRRRKAGQR